jgi:hypothetical protein
MPSPNRISALEVAPMFIALALTMVSVLIVPNMGPQRLVSDRLRFYIIIAAASLMVMIAGGLIAVRTMGSQRILMLIVTLASLPFVPFALTPIIEWLNASFDHAPPSSVVYQVRGHISHGRTGPVKVRLKVATDPGASEFVVERKEPFFSNPPPLEGALLRADVHRGALSIAWISALSPNGQTKE